MKYNSMKSLLAVITVAAISFSCTAEEEKPLPQETLSEIRGADMSHLPEVRESGIAIFNRTNQPEDMLTTLKAAGANVIRLKLWKNPIDAVSGFASVKALSNEIQGMGLKTMLTVHYSDSWADPGKQTKPAQWQDIPFSQLQDSVYAYTKKIMEEIRPDYIQIGNEINSGFLWPEGNISNMSQMKTLLQRAVAAIRETIPETIIIIHYAGYAHANYLFSSISDIDYDLIGISYYPFWHGKDLNTLKQSLTTISNTAGKDIFIAETSYPFKLGWNDWTNNIIGQEDQILTEFPATPQGQKDFMLRIRDIIDEVPRGIGFCYWGAEWVSYQGSEATNGSPWENQACWDFDGKALPVLEVFENRDKPENP